MVPIDRRAFVTASGLVAIAGCLARGNENAENESNASESVGSEVEGNEVEGSDADGDALPKSLTTVLDSVPTEVQGADLRQLYVVTSDPDDERADRPTVGYGGQAFDLDADAVDRSLTGIYGELEGTIGSVAGDFDAEAPREPERTATSIEDGLAVTATSGNEPWDAGIEAVETATDDPDVGVDGEVPIETLFEPIADAELVVALADLDAETIPDGASIDTETVEAIALGRETDLDAREETVTYVAAFAEDESSDETVIEEMLRTDNDAVAPEDVEIETDDDRATTTFTRELPQQRLPDTSPDTYVGIVSRPDRDTVTLRISGEESVDASNLEYRIDGDVADPPWKADATLEPRDRFEIDVPPMTLVSVHWIDPELEDIEQPLGRSVVGSNHAFEADYDHESGDLTVEYAVERALEPDRFDVVRRSEASVNEDATPLSEYVDTLGQGTEFVVTDVDYGESVRIEIAVDRGTELPAETVFWYDADPPGSFRHAREDGTDALVYEGDAEVVSETYRVLVNGDVADAQWSDVAETLSGGERLEIDVAAGDGLAVEYLGSTEPMDVFSREIVPTADFTFDVGESAVEITHDGGESMDAEDLTVQLHPIGSGPHRDAFTDEYATVEEGDSITLEYAARDESEPERPEIVMVLYGGRLVDTSELLGDGGSGSGASSGDGSGSVSTETAASGD